MVAAQAQQLAEVHVGAHGVLALAAASASRRCCSPASPRRGSERDPEGDAGGRCLRPVAGRGCDGERLLAALARLGPAAKAHQGVALGGEQSGADRRRLVADQREGARVTVQRGVVVPRVVLAEALVEPRGAFGIGGVVVRLERGAPERERARLVAAVAGRLRCARQQVGAVAGRRPDGVPQGQRALVLRARLGERVGVGGLRARLERRARASRGRRRGATGRRAAPRRRPSPVARPRSSRAARSARPGSAPRRPPRRSARVAALRPRRRGRGREGRHRAPRAAPGRGPGPARSARAPRGSQTVDGTCSRRSRRAANSSSTKNGFPPARACSSPASAAGNGVPGDRLELAGDVVAAERLEIDPDDERAARQLRHEPPRRVLGRELAGAVREREHDRARRAGCARGTRRSRGSSGRPSAGPSSTMRSARPSAARPSISSISS